MSNRSRSLLLRGCLLIALLALGVGGCSSGSLLPTFEEARDMPDWLLGLIMAVATLGSEDVVCIAAGILASRGVWSPGEAIFWCLLGILGGNIALYFVGRVFGEKAVRLPVLRYLLTPERIETSGRLFDKYGAVILLGTRFIPGSRVAAYVGAGVSRYSIVKFSIFLFIGGALWAPLVVWLAMRFGRAVQAWMEIYQAWALPAVILLIVLIWFALRVAPGFFSWKGRRLLLSRWRRFSECEFWPVWALYPPVILLLLRLWIRDRFVPSFTAVNPGIVLSGLALESKSRILRGLCGGHPDDPQVAAFTLVPLTDTVEQKLERVSQFQQMLQRPWPIVLKPDIGERGLGVAILHQKEDIRRYVESCREDFVAQEFVPGEEFGVFYHRHPDEERGHITSITRKQLVSVTGDGQADLERLILLHPRGLRMARFFLSRHREHLNRVPAAGEVVLLGELGTHSRGALLTDAREHITEPLLDTIEALSRQFDGFYFGRFDLRVPDVQALREGRDLKVLELNAVGAEPLHIYQPGTSAFRAWRDLRKQWRIAWDIGAVNIRRGARPGSNRDLFQLLRSYAQREWYEVEKEARPAAKTTPGQED